MTDAHLPCPECGAPLIVDRSKRARWVDAQMGLVRVRYCRDNETDHVYPTMERIRPRDFLRNTELTGRPNPEPYNRNRLHAELSLKLSPVLSKSLRNEVVSRVEHRLLMELKARRAPKKMPATYLSDGVVSVLHDYSAERQLEKYVADSLRKAHVLYALSQEELRFSNTNRVLSLRGDGFDALPGILDWLHDQYRGHYETLRPKPAPGETPNNVGKRTDRWHTLRVDAAPHPRTVLRRVLRDRSTVVLLRDLAGEPNEQAAMTSNSDIVEEWQPFQFELWKFERSLHRAFAGRPNHVHNVNYTAQWVLFALAGQDTVRLSDLVAMTTQCLRRVDAIASLRWAIVGKSLTPNALSDEILGMLKWPAPRLVFEPDAAADMRTSSQIAPFRYEEAEVEDEDEEDFDNW